MYLALLFFLKASWLRPDQDSKEDQDRDQDSDQDSDQDQTTIHPSGGPVSGRVGELQRGTSSSPSPDPGLTSTRNKTSNPQVRRGSCFSSSSFLLSLRHHPDLFNFTLSSSLPPSLSPFHPSPRLRLINRGVDLEEVNKEVRTTQLYSPLNAPCRASACLMTLPLLCLCFA